MSDKDYLGDGVYVESDSESGDIVLTTENGIEATNRIVLEQSAWQALLRWVMRKGEK